MTLVRLLLHRHRVLITAWSVLLIASSVTGGPWTEQQRAQFRTDLEASVRTSHKNLTG